MKRITTVVTLLAMTLQITACSGLLSSDTAARQHYLLQPYSAYSGANAGDPWPVLVLTVSAVPGLDTDHIQALGPDARLIQYANARWADFLPEVLTSVMRRSLAASGRFQAVNTKHSSDSNQWRLDLEVQQFYGILDGTDQTSSVNVRFEGNLRCNDQEHQLQLNASESVRSNRLESVVAAHQQALDETSQQLMNVFMDKCIH
jgi:ABC-type uncharacterized transport system auxiliary subunit